MQQEEVPFPYLRGLRGEEDRDLQSWQEARLSKV
jgi:hypothetical protein